jgi:hypothetical protein
MFLKNLTNNFNLRCWRKKIQYQRIQAAAARIWQQMLKITKTLQKTICRSSFGANR